MSTLPKFATRILAVGLALALSVATSRAATPDKLIPSDADAVFHVNLKELADSAVIKKYALDQIKTAIKENAQVGPVLKQLNFDPIRDLNSVTTTLSVSANIRQPDFLLIAHGNFDLDRIHGTLGELVQNQKDKFKATEHGKLKIYEVAEGPRPIFAAFIDKETLVGSIEKSQVEGAIDQSQGKREGKLKKELAVLVEKANGKQTAWGAFAIPATLRDQIKNVPQPQVAEIGDKIEGMTFGVTVKDDVAGELAIHVSDEKATSTLSELLDQGKGVLGGLALQAPQGELLSEIIEGIKVEAKGKAVTLRVKVSADMIDKAYKKARENN